MKDLIRSFCLLILLPVFAAQAEPARVALVIGNAAYREGALKNPVNDARDMKKALEQAGFSVTLVENADLKQMKEAVRGFGHKLNADSIGLFYFSGHGVRNDDGQNYLLPVGNPIQSDAELEYEAMNGSFVLDVMRKSGSKTNLVFLDACRNNPLKYASGRSMTRGLATMDKRGGILISYATEPGQVAQDGNGRNSPYTAGLIKWMREPLTLESMLKRVANEVAAATGNKQTPWYDTSLMADFYFTAPTEKQTAQSSESKLVSPQGTPIEQFEIDEELIQSYPELIALIINTESMEDDERQYWFNIMPSMNNEQIQRLYDILHTEKEKLAALEENFVTEIKALDAYANEDYSRAFFLYRPLAENGDASAQYKLGLMYENGQGTKRDMEKAREWYEKAAANGYEAAKEALKNLP